MPTPRAGYYIDGVRMPSVTTVLGMMSLTPTDALCQWAANLQKEGKDWKKVRNRAGQVGTAAHAAIEHFPNPPVRDDREDDVEPWTDEEWARIEAAFRNHGAFVKEHRPQILLQEVQLVNAELRTGGTPDLVARMHGRVYLIDHKTSKSLDGKVVAQTAAYAYMIEKQHGIVIDGGALVAHHRHNLTLKVVPLPPEKLALGLEAFRVARALYDLGPKLKKSCEAEWLEFSPKVEAVPGLKEAL